MNDMKKSLNILWLWPDILSQHGDRGNVLALERICGLYGIEPIVTRVTGLSDPFDLDGADIVMLGPGELAVMPRVSGALSKRYEELKAWTENGGVLFTTGPTGAALGIETTRLDGSRIFGIGLLHISCSERETVLGDDLIIRVPNTAGTVLSMSQEPSPLCSDHMTVYGIQIQMMDVSLSKGQPPLGDIVYGYGNNGKRTEGAIQGNVIFTNALGPVLVKNPWLTLHLINRALGLSLEFDPALFELELASAKAIEIFNEKKEKPK